MQKRSLAEAAIEHPLQNHPPDGGWGWLVTLSAFVISVFVEGMCLTFGIFFPELLRYFGESKGKTQLLNSLMVGSLLCFGPVVSALVNKYSCRRVAGSGAVIASAGFFLSSFSPNLDVMIFFYSIIGGIGLGQLYLPSIVMIGIYFDKRRAFATGIALSGAGVGGLVFAPLSEYLLETYGWRGTMWIISAIILNGVVCSAVFKPLETDYGRNISKTTTSSDRQEANHSDVCCQQFCTPIKDMFDFSLLKSPTMLMYGASCFLIMFGFYVPPNFLPVWASDNNMSTEEGALLILLIGVSSTITRALVGYITDKPWANSLIINNTAMLIGGMSTCFVPFFTTFISLAVYSIVFGAITATFICLRTILMGELLGVNKINSSFGLVELSMGLSTFVGSPIAGVLTDLSGTYNIAFYFGGITLGLGGLICLPLRRISVWEKNNSNEFSVCETSTTDEKDGAKNVKIICTKMKSTIYTISEG